MSTNGDRSGRITSTPLRSLDDLHTALMHIASTSSLKLWYRQPHFIAQVCGTLNEDWKLVKPQQIPELLKSSSTRIKCVDVYPYSTHVPIELIDSTFPQLTSMIVRPHGTEHFYDDDAAQLPANISYLEWSNRKTDSFRVLVPKLSQLHRLEYLLLGHIDFAAAGDTDHMLADFFNVLYLMPLVKYLVLRFCHFKNITPIETGNDTTVYLKYLRVLKLDLCYGPLRTIINDLIALTDADNLRILNINSILEDVRLEDFYALVPLLRKLNIAVQFGLLQKLAPTNESGPPVASDIPLPSAPHELSTILHKLDLSFVENVSIPMSLMIMTGASGGPATLSQLMDIKLVQCASITDELLEIIARVSRDELLREYSGGGHPLYTLARYYTLSVRSGLCLLRARLSYCYANWVY
ncbi:unnamed protein product [Sphagnum balticum]